MVDLVRAEIVNAADPLNQGRVQLRAPVMGEHWQAWAPALRTDPAGAPPRYQVGDLVIIAFEGGDPDRPIVLGAVGAAKQPPAIPIDTKLAWDDLVLPPDTLAGLDEIVACGSKRGATAGYRALFSGPPGTGKTMAATLIASRLGLPIKRIDLSRIVSKYIGETEKALDRVFAEAEASGAVLLFDEADALFGKRSEVKDSHDRYANQEIAYLLRRLEMFAGLAIVTANFQTDIDIAFAKRFDGIVRFRVPAAGDQRADED